MIGYQEQAGSLQSTVPVFPSGVLPVVAFRSSSSELHAGGSMQNASAPGALCVQDERELWKEIRRARIRALKGRYAFVGTSSEDFARRKREEIGLER